MQYGKEGWAENENRKQMRKETDQNKS